ncbi:MAG TPA: hypothetical protein VMX79_01385 [bacterium]|nr:hypothetical protein [bacterium]
MRTRAAAIILASAFSLAATTTCDDVPPIRPPPVNFCKHLPTVEGNKWEYKVTADSMYGAPEEYKLTFEITARTDRYKEFPLAYVITITRDGRPAGGVDVAASGNACFVKRVGWACLIEDGMLVGEWSQTGLIVDFPLEYRRDVKIKVSAEPPEGGKFTCKELFLDNENALKPETWRELYADGVGLVCYENDFKEYRVDPFELVDWRMVRYELTSYYVQKDKWKEQY